MRDFFHCPVNPVKQRLSIPMYTVRPVLKGVVMYTGDGRSDIASPTKSSKFYTTDASLLVDSDWAELCLLSSGAYFQINGNRPFTDPTNTTLSRTSLRWGHQWLGIYKRISIEYVSSHSYCNGAQQLEKVPDS
jgi:hypothetical protein